MHPDSITTASSSALTHSRHPHVVVGVTGGIAAYKVPTLVRILREHGCVVTVVPTPAALDMVGKTTWEAISARPVYSAVSEGACDVVHVHTGAQADLLIIAPATANTLAKLACGIADNLLTATALVATCPILLAPAMHTQMWNNPATQHNVDVLRTRGFLWEGPECGRLTGSDSGIGRMAEPEDIALRALCLLGLEEESPAQAHAQSCLKRDLAGCRVLISAGGTHEPLDPVRYIGNNSTGLMGVCLANEAVRRGAVVTLIGANLDSGVVAGIDEEVSVRHVVRTSELHEAMNECASAADVIIMSAAVADFRPAHSAATKLKKGVNAPRIVELVENPDILSELAHNRRKENQIVVGFAAETGSGSTSYLEEGKSKAQRKGADYMVINRVGNNAGFGAVPTVVTIVDSTGVECASAHGDKASVASTIIDTVTAACHQS